MTTQRTNKELIRIINRLINCDAFGETGLSEYDKRLIEDTINLLHEESNKEEDQ